MRIGMIPITLSRTKRWNCCSQHFLNSPSEPLSFTRKSSVFWCSAEDAVLASNGRWSSLMHFLQATTAWRNDGSRQTQLFASLVEDHCRPWMWETETHPMIHSLREHPLDHNPMPPFF